MQIVGDCQTTGTKISFLPDKQIFTETREFKFDLLAKRLRELAFLKTLVLINLQEDKGGRVEKFYFEDGIREYVSFLNQNKNCLIENPISFSGQAPAETGEGQILLDVAMTYNDSFSDQLYSYANSIHNVEGGTHLSGFRDRLD